VTVFSYEEFSTLENQNHAEQKVAVRKDRPAVNTNDDNKRDHHQDEVLVQPLRPVVHETIFTYHNRKFFLNFLSRFVVVLHYILVIQNLRITFLRADHFYLFGQNEKIACI